MTEQPLLAIVGPLKEPSGAVTGSWLHPKVGTPHLREALTK